MYAAKTDGGVFAVCLYIIKQELRCRGSKKWRNGWNKKKIIGMERERERERTGEEEYRENNYISK